MADNKVKDFQHDVSDLGFRSRLLLDDSKRKKDFWELCNSYSLESFENIPSTQFARDNSREDKRNNNTPEELEKNGEKIVKNSPHGPTVRAGKSKKSCTNINELKLSVMSDIKLSKSDRIKYKKAFDDVLGSHSKARVQIPGQDDGSVSGISDIDVGNEGLVNAQSRRPKLLFLQTDNETVCQHSQEETESRNDSRELISISPKKLENGEAERTVENTNNKKRNKKQCIKARRWKSADAKKQITRCQASEQYCQAPKSISCPATRVSRSQATPLVLAQTTTKNFNTMNDNEFTIGVDSSIQRSMQGVLVCKSICSGLENKSALVSKIIEELFPPRSDDGKTNANSGIKTNEGSFLRKEIPNASIDVNQQKDVMKLQENHGKAGEHESCFWTDEALNATDEAKLIEHQKDCNAHAQTNIALQDKRAANSKQRPGARDSTYTEHQSNLKPQAQTDKTLQVRLPQISENTASKTKNIKLRLTSRERRRSPIFIRKNESKVKEKESSKSNDPYISLVCLKKLFPNAKLELW